MFYKVNNKNEIIETCIENYDGKFLETNKNIITGFDGKLIFEEELLKESYINAKIEYENKLKNLEKINELESWFEDIYKYKEQKYRRLIALSKLDDDGIDAKIKLTDLYIEAESKRLEIQMLEKEV